MEQIAVENNASSHDFFINKGEATLVVSRPGNGKNGWTIQHLLKRTKNKANVLAFALETPKRQFEYMGKNHDQERLTNWVIRDQAHVSVDEIEKVTRDLFNERDLDVLYIDNIDLLVTENKKVIENKGDLHSAILYLKGICEELGLTLVMGKTLPRDVDMRPNKTPVLKDVKLNKTTKNSIENIIGLYRDEYYHKDSTKPNTIEVISFKSNILDEGISFEEYYNIR